MPVVFLIAIIAVLVGIFFAATGRGGELAYEHADYAPLDLGPVSAADVGLLRPPTAMWGYNMQVTDEALDRIAHAMRERDVTITHLQEQLATLAPNGSYAELQDADARRAPGSPLAPEYLSFPEDGEISEDAALPEPPYAPYAAGFQETPYAPGAAGFQETPYAPGAADFQETPYAPGAADFQETPYAPEAAEAPEAPETPEPPQPVAAAEPAETIEAPGPPQTPLVLKASPAMVPPAPEPNEATQPSETLGDPETHDATQPFAAHDATQPQETPAPYEALGPQGSYDTHDWWAEQQAAAHEEEARHQPTGLAALGLAHVDPAHADLAHEDPVGDARPAAGPAGTAENGSLAAPEEQG